MKKLNEQQQKTYETLTEIYENYAELCQQLQNVSNSSFGLEDEPSLQGLEELYNNVFCSYMQLDEFKSLFSNYINEIPFNEEQSLTFKYMDEVLEKYGEEYADEKEQADFYDTLPPV